MELITYKHSEPALVVRAIMTDGKPRPAVIIGRRAGGWLIAPLTSRDTHFGCPNEPYRGSEVVLCPRAYLDDGFISLHRLKVLAEDDIDWRPIGRARRSLGERIVDVHGRENLTIEEIEEFLWNCVETP